MIGRKEMVEFWLEVWPVGFERAFVTGRIEGFENPIERELTSEQVRMLEAFQNVQCKQEQEFLLGLVA
jgi:hypothetical protein